MALTLSTYIAQVYFSAQVPEITYSTDDDRIDVEVIVGGDKVFGETFYPYGGRATVRDLRSLIEAHCENRHDVYSSVTVSASSPDGTRVQTEFAVIYCTFISSVQAASFVVNHFLTTRTAKILPRHELAVDYLSLYADGNSSFRWRYLVTYTKDGVTRSSYIDNEPLTTQQRGVVAVAIRYAEIRNKTEQLFGPGIRLLSFAVEIGERSFMYFVQDHQPKAMFLFANAFGCMEMALLDCETTDKVTTSRSIAVINGRSEFYNREHTKEYEVQSAPLTDEQSRWLEQMFTSYNVRHVKDYSEIEDDDLSNPEEILITDFTSEISDTDSELNTVKFTWQYAFNRPYIELRGKSLERRVFSGEYSKPFG